MNVGVGASMKVEADIGVDQVDMFEEV